MRTWNWRHKIKPDLCQAQPWTAARAGLHQTMQHGDTTHAARAQNPANSVEIKQHDDTPSALLLRPHYCLCACLQRALQRSALPIHGLPRSQNLQPLPACSRTGQGRSTVLRSHSTQACCLAVQARRGAKNTRVLATCQLTISHQLTRSVHRQNCQPTDMTTDNNVQQTCTATHCQYTSNHPVRPPIPLLNHHTDLTPYTPPPRSDLI
mmetsp:Transcript_27448/g.69815  ORF Transcript_27448/g.69815 Transcript_27448/m.69815 type:complete len:208 (+) Transcript_27448:191-814(+)